jgi:hypothetical protein
VEEQSLLACFHANLNGLYHFHFDNSNNRRGPATFDAHNEEFSVLAELSAMSQTLLPELKQERTVFYDFIRGNVNDRHGCLFLCRFIDSKASHSDEASRVSAAGAV